MNNTLKIPLELWDTRPNSNSIETLGSMSKFQCHRTSRKHVQNQTIGPLGSMSKLQSIGPLGSTSKFQIHQTSRKHAQTSNPSDLWEARLNFKPSDLWEAHPNFKSIGPLGSTFKLQTIGPLGSTSKLQIHRTFGKHVQTSNPLDLWEARQNSISLDL